MSTPTRGRIANFLGIIGSAVAASAAVERGARPRARDLKRLGIDAAAFGRIVR